MTASLTTQVQQFKEYLVKVGHEYHPAIPLKQIFARLPADVTAVDEDGEPWEGLLCGREGLALIDLVHAGRAFKTLVLRWYRMGSGKYEVVGYLS